MGRVHGRARGLYIYTSLLVNLCVLACLIQVPAVAVRLVSLVFFRFFWFKCLLFGFFFFFITRISNPIQSKIQSPPSLLNKDPLFITSKKEASSRHHCNMLHTQPHERTHYNI